MTCTVFVVHFNLVCCLQVHVHSVHVHVEEIIYLCLPPTHLPTTYIHTSWLKAMFEAAKENVCALLFIDSDCW